MAAVTSSGNRNAQFMNNQLAPNQSQWDYFKAAGYNSGLGDYGKDVGGMGKGLINGANQFNIFAGGGSPANAWAKLGYSDNYPDINNPNTMPTINKWMSNLQGGLNNNLDAYSKQMANASVASTRGGFGMGNDPYSSLRAQQMNQLAGMYGQNFSQSVDWMRQKSLFDQQNANALANLYGNMYSANLKSGTDLMGLQGNALNSDAANQLQWLGMGQNAWNNDTNWNRDAPNREYLKQMNDVNLYNAQDASRNSQYQNAWARQDKQVADQLQKDMNSQYNMDLLLPQAWNSGAGKQAYWRNLLVQYQNSPFNPGISDRLKRAETTNTGGTQSKNDQMQWNIR